MNIDKVVKKKIGGERALTGNRSVDGANRRAAIYAEIRARQATFINHPRCQIEVTDFPNSQNPIARKNRYQCIIGNWAVDSQKSPMKRLNKFVSTGNCFASLDGG